MIDTHCHLAGDEFADDLDDVVAARRAAGVSGALVILAADDEQDIERRADGGGALARRPVVDRRAPACGRAVRRRSRRGGAAGRRRRSRRSRCARALGEIGLDYHYDFAPRDAQQAVFREQIGSRGDAALPIVIHTREAEDGHVPDPERGSRRARSAASSTASPATGPWRGARSTPDSTCRSPAS